MAWPYDLSDEQKKKLAEFAKNDFSLTERIGQGLKDAWNNTLGDPGSSADAKAAKQGLMDQGLMAGDFANRGQQGYDSMTGEIAKQRQFLMDLASGKHSVAGEQLRQGAQQNIAGQRSMVAGARPHNAAMAARNAMNNAGRIGTALSGQQALAGLQERQMAQQALAQLNLGQRGQDVNVGLGSRGNAINAYGNVLGQPKEPSGWDKAAQAATAAAAIYATSDRRLKTDVHDGASKARSALDQLMAYSYRYKDPARDGAGPQLGVMAQDLERAGLGQAVVNTRAGKAIDAGKLSGANTAMLATLAKRVDEMEGKRKANVNQREMLMRMARRTA